MTAVAGPARVSCKDATAVTREHKLALIVGFALVLVLAVLFSDHLSKARAVEQSAELQVASSKQVGASPKGLKPPSQIIESETAAAGGTAATRPPLPGITPPQTIVAQADAPATTLPPITEPNVVKTAAAGDATLPHEQFDMVPDTSVRRSDLPVEVQKVTETVGTSGKPVSAQAMKRHDVREGESVYSIAKSVYGDGSLWPKLRDFNKGKINDNGSMRSGVTLMLPPKDVLLGEAVLAPEGKVNPQPLTPGAKPGPTPAKPDSRDLRPGRETRIAGTAGQNDSGTPGAKSAFSTYTVKKGDVLEDVARRTLGSPSRWRDIADANRGIDPNVLKVGQTLRIPAR